MSKPETDIIMSIENKKIKFKEKPVWYTYGKASDFQEGDRVNFTLKNNNIIKMKLANDITTSNESPQKSNSLSNIVTNSYIRTEDYIFKKDFSDFINKCYFDSLISEENNSNIIKEVLEKKLGNLDFAKLSKSQLYRLADAIENSNGKYDDNIQNFIDSQIMRKVSDDFFKTIITVLKDDIPVIISRLNFSIISKIPTENEMRLYISKIVLKYIRYKKALLKLTNKEGDK